MGNAEAPKQNSVKLIGDEFGKRLYNERISRKLSISSLAQKANVTKGYVSRLEHGKAKPSKQMIERIAKILKIKPSPLYVLAGYLPIDIKNILYSFPEEAPNVLRETFDTYVAGNSTTGYEHKKSQASLKTTKPIIISKKEHLYEIFNTDCFAWLDKRASNSIHAVVTDPPYGIKEYTHKEKKKLRSGRGGVWRIPPSFDGCLRSPLPRFTVLSNDDKLKLENFFTKWAIKVFKVLVPGGHVLIATNPLFSHIVYSSIIKAGFEKRGEIIRLVQTLRGGDRPKNAHNEFEDVTVIPRSCWEPWGLFRKPCEGRVQDNLRKWKTGGLRRISKDQPFSDVIKSSPTRSIEREIASHPSLKPQALMRQLVRASLPLGEGIVLDPFMGGGSTIAAACALNYKSIGIESDLEFYKIAVKAIPRLAAIVPNGNGNGSDIWGSIKIIEGQEPLFEQS